MIIGSHSPVNPHALPTRRRLFSFQDSKTSLQICGIYHAHVHARDWFEPPDAPGPMEPGAVAPRPPPRCHVDASLPMSKLHRRSGPRRRRGRRPKHVAVCAPGVVNGNIERPGGDEESFLVFTIFLRLSDWGEGRTECVEADGKMTSIFGKMCGMFMLYSFLVELGT